MESAASVVEMGIADSLCIVSVLQHNIHTMCNGTVGKGQLAPERRANIVVCLLM